MPPLSTDREAFGQLLQQAKELLSVVCRQIEQLLIKSRLQIQLLMNFAHCEPWTKGEDDLEWTSHSQPKASHHFISLRPLFHVPMSR